MTWTDNGNLRRLAVFGGVALGGAALALHNPLATAATGFNNEIAAGGTVIYAALRSIGSIMSVAKDADLGGSVAVASVTVSPGQVLHPVTATVDRMADLLFGLVIVSGVLSVALPAIAKIGGAVLAAGAVVGAATPERAGGALVRAIRRFGRAAVAFGLVTAIVVPASYALAFVVGNQLTADAWTRASTVFERLSEDYGQQEAMAPAAPAAEPAPQGEAPAEVRGEAPGGLVGMLAGLVDGIVSVFEQSGSAVAGAAQATTAFAASLPAQISANAEIVADGVAMAGELFEASVQIGTAYLVRLVVLPGLILIGALWMMREVARERPGAGAASVLIGPDGGDGGGPPRP